MKKRFYPIIVAGIAVLILLMIKCGGSETVVEPDPPAIKDVQISAPSHDAQYNIGDEVLIKIEVNHPELVSNLELWIADTLYQGELSLENQEISIETINSRVGRVPLYLKYTDGAGAEHRDNRSIVLFSDVVPNRLKGSIVNTYPHNPKSYTQGLEFYNGKLYEGTGQKGQSVLAEVSLTSGEQIRKVDLDPTVFGEGITILNDTVYQLSYVSQKCFVYDVNTFEKLTEFDYQGEGWGLCNNGESLIMSNGSSKIEWRDPRTFNVTKTLQVFDDQSEIDQINELELVNGELYANLYTDTKIAKIDTSNGKILEYIDFTPLVKSQPAGVDVLNGIAYDQGRFYITGKWWPNLYEVTFE